MRNNFQRQSIAGTISRSRRALSAVSASRVNILWYYALWSDLGPRGSSPQITAWWRKRRFEVPTSMILA